MNNNKFLINKKKSFLKNLGSKLLVGVAAFTLAASASAQIGGKNVVLVHGFQAGDLSSPPGTGTEISRRGAAYWSAFWGGRAEARIDWPSDGRIEGAIAQRAFDELLRISRAGTCNAGCVFVTHSTGDLVTRHLLANQARWLSNAGAQPIPVLAVIDMAGAGGGTELADLALQVANGGGLLNLALKAAVKAFTGIDPQPGKLGVVNDLVTTKARTLSTSPNSVPRLRMAGGGVDMLGITKPFIRGADDSVVPVHSSCGASSAGTWDSCVSSIGLDGKLSSQSAPSSRYYMHYPVVMSAGANHGDFINNNTGHEMTVAFNNFTVNGVTFDFATDKVKRGWWIFANDFLLIRNSASNSVSNMVFQTLNN